MATIFLFLVVSLLLGFFDPIPILLELLEVALLGQGGHLYLVNSI
ncbi:MAG: hypothetical protein WAX06_10650 [Lactococcus lactis]